MRPLVVLFLLVLAFSAFFVGVGAIGVVGLWRQQAAAARPSPATTGSDDTDAEEGANASPASGRIDGDRPVIPAAPRLFPNPAPVAVDGPRHPPALPPRPLPPAPAGPIDLPALDAVTHGKLIHVEPIIGGYAVAEWRDPQAYVEWPVTPGAPGWYNVELSFACDDGAGGDFVVAVAEQTLTGRARPTGGQAHYRTATLGAVHLTAEDTRLTVRPDGRPAGTLMNVRHVRLVPAP